MNKEKDPKNNQNVPEYRQNDKSYSVGKTTGMTIGELIDGIRGKIQHALENKASAPNSNRNE